MISGLQNGLYPVPPGKLATVVTYLEMRAPAETRPVQHPDGLLLTDLARNVDVYRDLFRRVGGQDWLWFSRLRMNDAELAKIVTDPQVTLITLMRDDRPEALLELDFREPGACELAFFGVTAPLIGTGAGRFLMNRAIELAWSRPISLFHVHTCTLDSPGALSFYRRSGFAPVRQEVEIADDPRLSGELDVSAGAHIPIFAL